MDDYLDSLDTVDQAVDMALQVKEIHAKAGFHIRNWMSSSKEVLSRVRDSAEEQVKSFSEHATSSSERVPRMSWFSELVDFACRFERIWSHYFKETSYRPKVSFCRW